MEIFIEKVRPSAITPTRGSEHAAGYDLYADLDECIIVKAGDTRLIPTGIKTAIPVGYAGFVYPRSGIATKEGLRLANCVGVIDADYRGEWYIAIHNDSEDARLIRPKERIAQVVIQKINIIDFVETKDLDSTERGAGGFGHTGK